MLWKVKKKLSLIKSLNSIGFCGSCSDVCKFKTGIYYCVSYVKQTITQWHLNKSIGLSFNRQLLETVV